MSALAYKYPLPHVTGIITERNFDAEIMYLKQLNPSLSSIGIIHGAGLNQLFAEEVILLESAIRKQNITPKRTSLSNGMLKNVDKEFLNNCDAIIILNNGVKQQQVQDIANYCDTTSKILCADTQYQHERIAINFNFPLEKTSHLGVDSMY